MKRLLCISLFILMGMGFVNAQTNPEDTAYQSAMARAQEYANQGDFNKAEAFYRKAAALNPESAEASYNLGNLYYNKEKNYSASDRYKRAADAAITKEEKHRIWHNGGNVLLKEKKYDLAVEAYKNALRNDPTDDETRYNLALAKQEQEKNGGGGGGDGDNDQNQDPNQDSKEGDKDQNSDGDKEGDDKEKKGDNKDGDKGQDKESDKGENSQGDNGKSKPQEDGKNNKQQQRPKGAMKPQQIKQILEAMENDEKKVQEKVNARKAKGSRVKTEKDW